MNVDSLIAKEILEAGVVSIIPERPISNISGVLSPVYIDINRLVSKPSIRSRILKELATKFRKQYPQADAIAVRVGTASPWATMLANYLDLPLILIRNTHKGHALQNQIEGQIQSTWSIVLCEAGIYSGKSSETMIGILRNQGASVLGLISIIDYEYPEAGKRLKLLDVFLISLIKYSTIMSIAEKYRWISPEKLDEVANSRKKAFSN